MGRIDKAMRRAAQAALDEAAPTPGQDTPVEFPPESADADEFASTEPSSGGEDVAATAVIPGAGDAEPGGKATSSPLVKDRRKAEAEPEAAAETPAPDQAPDGTSRNSSPPAKERRAPVGPGLLFHRIRPDLAQKIVIDDRIMPVSREQYRKLAAALHHAQENSGLGVVMIASAVAGEGKTLTACNLALTLSESYQRSVLLIDADLRKPMLHQLFQLDVGAGLGEGLTSKDDRRLPLHEVSPKLTILAAGRAKTDPMAALSSNRMRRVLDEARHAFDWVIVDTPPVGLMTDASLLSRMVDGAVLVVKAESTPYELVQRATENIGEDRILGAVLNRSMTPSHESEAYGYGSYESYLKVAQEGTDSAS